MRSRMLWYHAWLETRGRFFLGLGPLAFMCAWIVLAYPSAMRKWANLPPGESPLLFGSGDVELMTSGFAGYVWATLLGKGVPVLFALLGVMLGTGGLVREARLGTAQFTLSLPVSRTRLVAVRAATGALEMVALALTAALVVVALAPAVGESYSATDAAAYALILAASGMVFYAAVFLLSSTRLHEDWIGTIGIGGVVVLALVGFSGDGFAPRGIYDLMSARAFLFEGRIPWAGMAGSVAASAAMFALSVLVVRRRDF